MNASPGTPAQTGLWSGAFSWPLVSIHLNLMSDGRLLTGWVAEDRLTNSKK